MTTFVNGIIENSGGLLTLYDWDRFFDLRDAAASEFSSIVRAPLEVSVSDHSFSQSYLSSLGHLHHIQE